MTNNKYNPPPLQHILASASPRRKELLAQILTNFSIIPAQLAEKKIISHEKKKGLAPPYILQKLAQAKAHTISQQHPQAFVWGADTDVLIDNQILGKPADIQENITFLKKLSGQKHQVISAVALYYQQKLLLSDYQITTVYFRKLLTSEIKNFVQSKKGLDKAGGYAIQETNNHKSFVKKIEGQLDTVIGLPLDIVKKFLNQLKLKT